MREIYVIGVIHNLVSEKETIDVLEKFNPDQVMIEVLEEHLKNKKFKEYGKEFFHAYKWCKKNKKRVIGFDYWKKGWPTSKDMSKSEKKEYKKIEKILIKIVKRYGWKKFNKKKYENLLDIYVDKAKKSVPYIKEIYEVLPIRQKQMLKNIRKSMIKKGKLLILTGAGHLDFFQKKLKGAIFPFRE